MIRVVHYINQFYGGIGGEDKADYRPEIREGFAGPGMGLKNLLAPEAEIVATVVCGDTYFNENMEEATAEILDLIAAYQPDIFIAGPAFNAGRYGVACGAIAKAVKEKFKIPVVSAMYRENPGADMYKKDVIMAETTNSAAGMRKALPNLAQLSLKLARQEELGSPEADKYLAQGLRKNIFMEKRGSTRAVEMLVKKLRGEEFQTEFEMPNFDRVEPFAAVKDIKNAKIALVTSGGIVPKGNPDHIEASSASRYGKYDIKHILNMTEESHETAHGGYDPVYANSDSDCVLPVDVLRDLENSGEIGELHRYFYSTTGNGTAVADAKRWGTEIAKELVADGVTAVILTSTWGTCTRCGATLVKEIERVMPVVHMCTITPISLTVGANRIVPTVAIPHPLGNPLLTSEQQYKLRKELVERALVALETEITEQTVFEVK